ncbi:MAG: hypothetical protein U9O41_00135 [Candidatus Aerophobetes bacterium]|nr:hypothetical protein [Candidatus Aerophobetes bacterium]
MKKYFSVAILIIAITFLPVTPTSAQIDVGGEVKTSLAGTLDRKGNISSYLQESLDLELFLPPFDNTQTKFEMYFFNNPISGGFDYLIKKLYLKHKFEKLHLTIGRQPISWSFGSLLNPVDFSLGAMAMKEETSTKYQNAIEGYIPLNWNTSVSVVAAFPENSQNIKWGLRGRTVMEGYDLTLNYVQEPEMEIAGVIIPASKRIGFTGKGDLGPLGIYGAVGYYSKDNDNDDLAYLIGGDYSHFFEMGNKVYLQLEYLSIKRGNLSSILGPFFSGNINDNLDEKVGLLLGLANYEIDEFSQISLMTISSLNDKSMIITPGYHNQLSSNLSFNFDTAIYFGKDSTLFGPGLPEEIQKTSKAIIEAGFTYTF